MMHRVSFKITDPVALENKKTSACEIRREKAPHGHS